MSFIGLKYNSLYFNYDDKLQYECWTFNSYCSSLYNCLVNRTSLNKLLNLNINNISNNDLIIHCFIKDDEFHKEIIKKSHTNFNCEFCGVYYNDDCIYNGNCLHIVDILINLKYFDEALILIKKFNWIPKLSINHDIEQLKFCLDNNSNPNQWINLNWSTILHGFIKNKNYEACILLLNYKANPFIEGHGDGHVNKCAYDKANSLITEDVKWMEFINLCDSFSKNLFA